MRVPFYFVPLPAFLLPHLPAMPSGVLRLVLAICSKTIPWNKTEDILSISQLMALTGLCRRSLLKALSRALGDGYIRRRRSGRSYAYQLVIPDEARRPEAPQGKTPQEEEQEVDTHKKDVTSEEMERGIVDNSVMLETINEEIGRTSAGAPLQNIPWLAQQAAAQGLREGDLWELWRACRGSRLRARVGYFIHAICGDGKGPQKPIERDSGGMGRKRNSGACRGSRQALEFRRVMA